MHEQWTPAGAEPMVVLPAQPRFQTRAMWDMNRNTVGRLTRFIFGLILISVPAIAFFVALLGASSAQAGSEAAAALSVPRAVAAAPVLPAGTPDVAGLSLYAAPAVSPTITSSPPTTGSVGSEYRYNVVASTTVITWTLVTAPSGMEIDPLTSSSALVTWTPTTAGTFAVVIEAANADGFTRQTYTITVIAATRTPTPTRTPVATPIYVDQYEPNNTLQTAYTLSSGQVLSAITLWPAGDIDYFRFHAKSGSVYEVSTSALDPGLDTYLTVYDTNGNVIGTNDDAEPLSRASQVTFSAGQTGFYFFSVVNRDPTDPVDQTYSAGVTEVLGTATPTRVASVDDCEPNGTFQTACALQLDVAHSADFVPPVGTGEDNDFYRIWVKEGLYYTCETSNLSTLNDTNLILYTCPGEECGVGGNDDIDRLAGNLGSRVGVLTNYTGWLYALVGPGPNLEPEYALSPLYTYTMMCTQSAPPTPSPTPTRPATGGGGAGDKGGGTFPTPTLAATPTLAPGEVAVTPSPTPRPVVVIQPLPTATPAGPPVQQINLEITVYYDLNNNFTPESTEGVMDVAVAVYDNASGQLLSLGFTNGDGRVRFGPLTTTGPVRLVVPYLNFSQIVADESAAIQLRIAPRPLPGTIP